MEARRQKLIAKVQKKKELEQHMGKNSSAPPEAVKNNDMAVNEKDETDSRITLEKRNLFDSASEASHVNQPAANLNTRFRQKDLDQKRRNPRLRTKTRSK